MNNILFESSDTIGIEELLPKILYQLPKLANIEDDVILTYVNDIVIDFAKRTRILTSEATIELQDCVELYRLCVPFGELLGIKQFSIKNRLFKSVKGIYMLDGIRMYLTNDGFLNVQNHDNIPNKLLDVIFFIAPSKDTCVVPRVFYSKYEDAIVAGVLYRLSSMVFTEWGNTQASAIYKADYDNYIAKAISEKVIGLNNSFKRATPPRPY